MTVSLSFDRVLTGPAPTVLLADDGTLVPIDPPRWRAPAGPDDDWLLARCTGPTIDLGCGPGRLVEALRRRGIAALGVDSSPRARRLCRARGAPMLRRDLFDPLPDEGRWAHVLLADGNIGIGGDPVRLLARAAALLAPGGTVVVETDPDPLAHWTGTLRPPGTRAAALRWARVGAEAVADPAAAAGLRVVARGGAGPRRFVELAR